jgi:alpha-tubulin suppressor-like RCC1 family protein
MNTKRTWMIWGAGALLAGGMTLGACKGKEGGGEDKPTAEGATNSGEGAAKAPEALTIEDIVVHNGTGMALMSNGTVRAWGANAYMQLGNEDTVNGDVATPIEVPGITGAKALYGGGSNLAFTACAVDGGGEVSCWGHADLIPGQSKTTEKPVKVAALKGTKKLAFGGGMACSIQPDDSLMCWGYNAFGAVGTGGKTNERKDPTKLEGMTDIVDVGLGNNHGCALHKTGEVSCWGYNSSKQADPKATGRDNILTPKKVEGIKDAKVLGVGYDVSCVVGADKKAKCWGDNFYNKSDKPVPSSDGTVAFSSNYSAHTCLINDKGEVMCWGDNAYGQAGSDPSIKGGDNLSGDPKKVEGISGATAVATGYVYPSTCAATKTDVYCFGMNRFGGLGDGTLLDSHKPVKVKDLTAATLPEPVKGYDKIKTHGAATSFDGLPKECTKPTTLKAELKKIKGISEFPVVFADAKLKERKRDDDKMGKYYDITLRSYPYDPSLSIWKVDQRPRGEQVKVHFGLYRYKADTKKDKSGKETTTKTALDVDAGTYRFGKVLGDDRRELSAFSGAVAVRATNAMFGGFFTAVDGAKVTYAGDDWVCGELEMKNSKSGESLTGVFAAPVEDKRK